MRIAFIIQKFPQTSEVFIINQIADLMDKGIDVEVFSFEEGDPTLVSDRYDTYRMTGRVSVIGMPGSRSVRALGALKRITLLLLRNPVLLWRTLMSPAYGKRMFSLRLLFAVYSFAGESFDLVHCHFGKLANQYLPVRRVLRHRMPMLTSFYGYDVSAVPKAKGSHYYDALKRECHRYIVMSNDMKERVVTLGFPAEEITVLPVSIDVDSLPFEVRTPAQDTVEMISVGRFVEKKGFDDLLRALALVKEKATKPFHMTIVGGGLLEEKLKQMVADLKLTNHITFAGYLNVQEIIKVFLKKHLYIQPSKTASDGDME